LNKIEVQFQQQSERTVTKKSERTLLLTMFFTVIFFSLSTASTIINGVFL